MTFSSISRRALLATLAAAPALPQLLPTAVQAQAPASALSSWNDGPAKQAIIDFVRATTEQGSPNFVPPEERIATFDQDGTLWVEHPVYSQMMYCLDRVPVLAAQKPELKKLEPFKTVLSGNREAIAKLALPDLEKIIVATLTGMTTDEFDAEVKKWLAKANDPRWKRPYTELTYQPMRPVPQRRKFYPMASAGSPPGWTPISNRQSAKPLWNRHARTRLGSLRCHPHPATAVSCKPPRTLHQTPWPVTNPRKSKKIPSSLVPR